MAGAPARARFRDVFGLAEYRALWSAQVLSVTGDQLARVALTVLVFDRTGSALLAAVTFAASVLPTFIGGVALSGIADRLPRRQVMIGADVASGVLVAIMALPGLPLALLIVLLFAVTMIGALFLAARAAIYPDILEGDRYVLGTAVAMTTINFAQVVGFASGGAVVGLLGARPSLLADAATFGASALITRAWVRARPAPRSHQVRERNDRAGLAAGIAVGLRLTLGDAAMRTPMLFGWLCACYELFEGVATPLARSVGGGAATVGLILAASAFGTTLGALLFSRLVGPSQRVRWTAPLAVAACACLVSFAARPGLAGVLVILAASGLFGCYQLAANASFVQATPPSRRSQAFGIAQGGISLSQGVAIILAGLAAEYVAPDAVIAVGGGIGALCALAVALTKPARTGPSGAWAASSQQ
jgi:MFS family permease